MFSPSVCPVLITERFDLILSQPNKQQVKVYSSNTACNPVQVKYRALWKPEASWWKCRLLGHLSHWGESCNPLFYLHELRLHRPHFSSTKSKAQPLSYILMWGVDFDLCQVDANPTHRVEVIWEEAGWEWALRWSLYTEHGLSGRRWCGDSFKQDPFFHEEHAVLMP